MGATKAEWGTNTAYGAFPWAAFSAVAGLVVVGVVTYCAAVAVGGTGCRDDMSDGDTHGHRHGHGAAQELQHGLGMAPTPTTTTQPIPMQQQQCWHYHHP